MSYILHFSKFVILPRQSITLLEYTAEQLTPPILSNSELSLCASGMPGSLWNEEVISCIVSKCEK